MTRFVGTPLRGVEFSSQSDEVFSARVNLDAHPRIRIDAGGRITWSGGSTSGDTVLFRDGANSLVTYDSLTASAGLVTLTTDGVPTASLPDGAIAVDTTNNVFYFRSDGAWSEVSGGGATLTISDTPPSEDLTEGDLWYESDTARTFVYYDSFWVEMGRSATAVVAENISGNAGTSSQLQTARIISLTNDVSGSVSFNGSQNVTISASVDYSAIATDILPAVNNTYSLGSASMRWQEVYVGPGSLYIEDAETGENVAFTVVDGFVKLNGEPLSASASIANNSVALGTHTTGNYIASLVAGTGVTLSNNSGEGATPTVAIGQAVGTTSNVTFNDVTVSGTLTVSGSTTTVNTETLNVADNIITLNSDVTTGSPTQNAGIEVSRGSSPTVSMRWNESTDRWEFTNDGTTYNSIPISGSIALGADTTGSYVQSLVAGTGVTVTNNSGESATPTIAIGQNVSSSATPSFSSITGTGTPGLTLSYSSGDEGGEMLLAKPSTNTSIAGTGVTIDVYQNKLRFFEQGGSARGAFIDITTAGTGVSTDLVNNNLDGLTDVTVSSVADKQLLVYDAATSQWKNADAIVSSGIAYKAGYPASKTSTGTLGQISIDGANGVMYVCTGTNQWQKVSLNAANFTNAGGFV